MHVAAATATTAVAVTVNDDGKNDGYGNMNINIHNDATTATTIFPINDVDDIIDFGAVADIIYTTIHEMPSTLSTCVGGDTNRITEIHDGDDEERGYK